MRKQQGRERRTVNRGIKRCLNRRVEEKNGTMGGVVRGRRREGEGESMMDRLHVDTDSTCC